jgi:segregation and condensation protein A
MDNGQASSKLSAARAVNQDTIALVAGEEIQQLPKDLYIPPEALEVFLETFEGPLDLLLYLIRRQNLDILQVKVSVITAQYMSYIELMQALQLELAAEYLLMAAMLAEIKSRMLLPRPEEFEDEDDPRSELIRRLQEYEQIKTAAEDLGELPRVERDIFLAAASKPKLVRQQGEPDVDLREVLLSLAQVLRRAELFTKHEVTFEPLSVRDRMGDILSRVNRQDGFIGFNELFTAAEGRLGVVVTFLAIMELIRESLLDFVQAEPFAPIHVRVGKNAVHGIRDNFGADLQYGGPSPDSDAQTGATEADSDNDAPSNQTDKNNSADSAGSENP